MHGYVTRSVRLVAVPMLLAGVVAGIAPVTAAAAKSSSTAPAASFTVTGQLSGVAATSARNAWAVGYTGTTSTKTLIVHWNGKTWKRVSTPRPVRGELTAVTATSARNAWAVGYSGSAPSKTLILHWNGKAWKRVPSPSPRTSRLDGVTATSARSAWAVGGTTSGTLILRWNGQTWKRVPSPSGLNTFFRRRGCRLGPQCLGGRRSARQPAPCRSSSHWNGTAWKLARSPISGRFAFLNGMAAASARSVWVVGSNFNTGKLLSMHWNGTAWKRVPTPNPGFGELRAVDTASGGRAWAVGVVGGKTLTLHWNGKAWKRIPSPSPAGGGSLVSAAAVSARSAWAVGFSGSVHVRTLSCAGTAPPGSDQSLATRATVRKRGSSDARVQHAFGPARRGAAAAGGGGRRGHARHVGRGPDAVRSPGGFFLHPRPAGRRRRRLHSQRLGGRLHRQQDADRALERHRVEAGVQPEPRAAQSLRGGRRLRAPRLGGRSTGGKTLILRWNGTSWKRVSSPSPGAFSNLFGVTAVSARSAWAVGSTFTSTGGKTLILRWNGKTWKRVSSPSGSLSAVAATSARNAWAVGATGSKTLILRWNGKTWKRVHSPTPESAVACLGWPLPPRIVHGRWATPASTTSAQ